MVQNLWTGLLRQAWSEQGIWRLNQILEMMNLCFSHLLESSSKNRYKIYIEINIYLNQGNKLHQIIHLKSLLGITNTAKPE
jgi:hypothetical protein